MPLPSVYSEHLEVIFVGTEPGEESLKTGHYYANPSNSFYKDLHLSGFTPRVFKPVEDRILLNYKIGLDDVYNKPKALTQRLKQYKPRAICFNSKEALARFIEVNSRELNYWQGIKAGENIDLSWNPIVWALYDSSGLARKYREKRICLLKGLRELLRKQRWTES